LDYQNIQDQQRSAKSAFAKVTWDDIDSSLLKDQSDHISKCAMLMFLSQQTYPEFCPIVIKLSTLYNKATKEDMKKAIRVAEYIYGCKDTHELVQKPRSVYLISAADRTRLDI
jgi:hypothetical protein